MKKEELINLIDDLGIDLEECCILSTSALVIRKLYPKANDLDLLVTEKGFEQLKNRYNLKRKDNGWYIINEKAECLIEDKKFWDIEKYDKYNLETLEKYYSFMKNSNREKDKEKIKIVKNILDNKKR